MLETVTSTRRATSQTTTAVVLAGGQGCRMNGQDKGLLLLQKRPFIAHILDVLQRQTHTIIINANRNHNQYARFGYPVLPDHSDGSFGPLSGIMGALEYCHTEFLLTVPCDNPWPPTQLLARLSFEIVRTNSKLVAAHDGQRLQPLFSLIHRSMLPTLQNNLQAGKYRVASYYAEQNCVAVDFSDTPQAFLNVNTPKQLANLTQMINQK